MGCVTRVSFVFASWTFVAVALVLAAGCSAPDPGFPSPHWEHAAEPFRQPSDVSSPEASDAEAPPSFDDAVMLASVANRGYATSGEFKQISTTYASTVTAGSSITEWVSLGAYDAYAKITPESSGSKSSLPEGAMIVREVKDASGNVTKLTLMAKAPKGYNPELGDWWFAVTTPTGAPVASDAGTEVGKLSACFSCHIPRSGDDFLFGVPASDREHP